MEESRGSRIILAERPEGMPTDQHLKMESMEIPSPEEGQMLLCTIYLSLDPYMRGRMSAAKSYAEPVAVGNPMEGATVCEVVESRLSGYASGDIVLDYIVYKEDVVEGLENAVSAFQGLLEGENFGKRIIQVGADPTRS